MKNNRRNFIRSSAALAALSLAGAGTARSAIAGIAGQPGILPENKTSKRPEKPRMKIAFQARPEPTEDHIKLIQQMGLDEVVLWTNSSKSSLNGNFRLPVFHPRFRDELPL